MIKPYFYLLSFKNQTLWYAGMRYANTVPYKEDLIIKYKTSSKKVHKLIADGYLPTIEDVVECDSPEQAAEYEYQFLKKCYKEKWMINEALNNPFRKCNKKNDIKYGNELNRQITGNVNNPTINVGVSKPVDRKRRPYDPSKLAGARPLKHKSPKLKMKVGRTAQRRRNRLKTKLFT